MDETEILTISLMHTLWHAISTYIIDISFDTAVKVSVEQCFKLNQHTNNYQQALTHFFVVNNNKQEMNIIETANTGINTTKNIHCTRFGLVFPVRLQIECNRINN